MNYLAQVNGSSLQTIETQAFGPGYKFLGSGLGAIVGASLPYLFVLAGFSLVVYIVMAGYTILTSKGDERILGAAKAKLTYGIAGFFIVFAAYWVVQILGTILGLGAINNIFR